MGVAMVAQGDLRAELDVWLRPFPTALSHPARRAMCPLHVAGLIGLGERESVRPMAARAEGLSYDRLQHFIAAGIWDAAPLERTLVAEADRLVGGPDVILVIDDTALPKEGALGRGRTAILPAAATLRQLAGLIKARWICERDHQQMMEELGRSEGRSWTGLHRHALIDRGPWEWSALRHGLRAMTRTDRWERARIAARKRSVSGEARLPRRGASVCGQDRRRQHPGGVPPRR